MAAETLSVPELCKALQQGERTVRGWVSAGCPHARGAGGRLSFSLEAVMSWLRSMGRSGKRGRPVGGGGPQVPASDEDGDEKPAAELSQEQIYKLTAAANLRIKELEAEKRGRLEQEARGELLDAREVEEAWAAEGIRFRVAVEALPARLSGQLVGLEKAEIEAQLASACRALLLGVSEKAPGVP